MFNTKTVFEKSTNAINTFRTVISDLVTVNEEIKTDVLAKEERISNLSSEVSQLTEQEKINEKIIGKIKNIIE